MDVQYRLKEVLARNRLDTKGVIARIARDTKLNVKTVQSWYHNKPANFNRETCGKIAGWLRRNGVEDDLPGALISARPAELFAALGSTGQLTYYLARYLPTHSFPLERAWLSLDDHSLAREIERLCAEEAGGRSPRAEYEYVPHHFICDDRPVPPDLLESDLGVARRMFKRMRSRPRENAVFIGSPRANHLVELVMADLAGERPFESSEGRLPVHLRYRDAAHPTSCFGGPDLPPSCDVAARPGLYFRDANDRWRVFPSRRGREDAGLVVVRHDPALGRTELAVFGGSGEGTAAMGEILRSDANEFWPDENGARDDLEVRVYACRIVFARIPGDPKGTERPVAKEIVPLDWIDWRRGR